MKLPNNDYKALMNAVATVGPVAINVDASSWSRYESGIFSGCNQVLSISAILDKQLLICIYAYGYNVSLNRS